jgi:hypothetical protein
MRDFAHALGFFCGMLLRRTVTAFISLDFLRASQCTHIVLSLVLLLRLVYHFFPRLTLTDGAFIFFALPGEMLGAFFPTGIPGCFDIFGFAADFTLNISSSGLHQRGVKPISPAHILNPLGIHVQPSSRIDRTCDLLTRQPLHYELSHISQDRHPSLQINTR